MITKCPECATKFEVDNALLQPEGRKVRCAQCHHVWLQMPQIDIFDNEAEDDLDFQSIVQSTFNDKTDALQSKGNVKYLHELYDEHEERTPLLTRLINAILTLWVRFIHRTRLIWAFFNDRAFTKYSGFFLGASLALVIFIYSFIGLRETITLHFPSFYNIYTRAGYEVTPAGKDLILENINAVWKHTDTGEPYVAAEGSIYNPSTQSRHIPPVKITLLLESGAKGDSFSKELENSIIESKKRTEFSFPLSDWPDGNTQMLITFDIEKMN